MANNKYVILAQDGTSHDLSRRSLFNEKRFDLPELLDQGWRPVHETPMGVVRIPSGESYGEYACVLILLTKD